MDRTNLKQYLFRIAQIEAQKNGFHFMQDVLHQISDLISSGVDNMSQAALKDERMRRIAEENTRNLTYRMVEIARRRHLHDRITIEVFNSTRSSICPLWPFC